MKRESLLPKLKSIIIAMFTVIAVVSLLQFCYWLLFAGEVEKLSRWVDESKDISTLPVHVVAPEGRLTLFADFDDIRGENIVLYLVNRTRKLAVFDRQDGDIYIKLEFKDDNGKWVRAQNHFYSFCGNSYFFYLELRPDQYWKFLGYFPSQGKIKEVRYRRYADDGKLVSNVGTGCVRYEEVNQAATDEMAIVSGDLAFVAKVAIGQIKMANLRNPRETAIFTLR